MQASGHIQFDEDNAYVLAVLARRQRTVNRDALLEHFDSILGQQEYQDILALRESASKRETNLKKDD